MMDVTLGAVDQGMVIPSDVYDLASLLVAELAYLHSEVPGLAAPKPYESVRSMISSTIQAKPPRSNR